MYGGRPYPREVPFLDSLAHVGLPRDLLVEPHELD